MNTVFSSLAFVPKNKYHIEFIPTIPKLLLNKFLLIFFYEMVKESFHLSVYPLT